MEKAKKTPEFWKKPRSIFSRQALPKKAKNEESGVKKANLTTLTLINKTNRLDIPRNRACAALEPDHRHKNTQLAFTYF